MDVTKDVVVIGGGFGGHVTLVDKNNYNFFPPLLYQVATGFLEVSNISYPFRKLFHNKKNISFRMEGVQNIYAIGDTCIQATDNNFPQGHPQLAQVAIQQGKSLAENFKAMQTGKPLVSFSYLDKGSMAIIGRNKAVADIPKPKMK